MKPFFFAVLLFCFFANAPSVCAQGVTMNGTEVKPSSEVSFKPGTATLTAASDAALLAIKEYLDSKSYISTMRIEGHIAGATNNQKLSEARAMAVAKWLIAHGVDCKRLVVTGFGANKPIAVAGGASSTRITFINAALRGHAIGGMSLDGGGKVAGDACVD